MQSLVILGRQPLLGAAELESLYGADKVKPVGKSAAIVDVDPCLFTFDRLGGSLKFCKVLTALETTSWPDIEKFLVNVSPGHSQTMPPGKMTLGLSLYGFDISVKQITASGFKIKKAISKTGRSVRFVANQESALNTAAVHHNKLTNPNGWELIFIKDGNNTVVAQTVKVQNIASYTKRDRGRPKRDTKVGMLPPKLAQIIINLATGTVPESVLKSICDVPLGDPVPRPNIDQVILDPFCGTGVILQEVLLMGYKAFGTDIDKRMVSYAQENLDWAKRQFKVDNAEIGIEQADAMNGQWTKNIDFVASETFLGPPFTSVPHGEYLNQAVSDCNRIVKQFLTNIHSQIQPGTRLCLAVPAWRLGDKGFKHLPVVDQISDLGYNSVIFELARPQNLIYYRNDQIVARQLIVITRE